MTDETLLEICNARAFRGDTEVFTDLSLVIKRGESVAILGPNGAGKSTLLKLITRDIYPVVRAGSSIKVFGKALIPAVSMWWYRVFLAPSAATGICRRSSHSWRAPARSLRNWA